MEHTVISDQDGLVLKSDIQNNRYIVEMPNSYDIYWRFNDKNFAERLPSDNKAIAVFGVNADLLDEKGMDKFDEKVSEARKVYRDTKLEKADFENVLGFDLAENGKTVSFVYKNPPKGFCVGEVLKTGTYFVAQKSGEDADKIYVRMLHTNRFLSGKSDFENREATVAEKFPVGSVKYVSFGDNGKIVVKDYQPKQTQNQSVADASYDQKATQNENQGIVKNDTQGVSEADELVKRIAQREQVSKPASSQQSLEQKKNLYMSQKMKH